MFLVIVEICLFFCFLYVLPSQLSSWIILTSSRSIYPRNHMKYPRILKIVDLMKSKTEQRCRTLDLFEKRSLLQTQPSLHLSFQY